MCIRDRFFPFAIVLQVTPIVAIFPLINIYVNNQTTKLLLCAWIVAFFPILSNRVVVMAARPGRVFGELTVDAPYPRDEAFRTSPDYAALCRQASDVLVNAINSTAGPHHDGH